MMDQTTFAPPTTRSAYEGWVRLWETIYDCRWPGRDRDTVQWLAAYLDWRHEQ
jgi:hypothetical protein